MIYVCIRCRFHYGPVAQVRSFQEHRGDLIKLGLITGHTGSWETTDGGEKRCNRGGKEKKREEAYLQPGHTHLTYRERVNCNLPSKTASYHRQAFSWKRKREEQGEIDGRKSVTTSVKNRGQLWTVMFARLSLSLTSSSKDFHPKLPHTPVLYMLQGICNVKKCLCKRTPVGSAGGMFGLIITCPLEIRKKCFVKRKHGRQSSIPVDPGAAAPVIGVSLEIPLWPTNVIASEQSP